MTKKFFISRGLQLNKYGCGLWQISNCLWQI